MSCDDDIIMKPAFGDEEYRTIEQYMRDNEEFFSIFIELMDSTRLDDALGSYNPHGITYTLFLPTNDAFSEFFNSPNNEYANIDLLLQDLDYCSALVRYHLVTRAIHTNDFPYGALPDSTATGDYLTIGFSDNLDSTVYKVNNLAPIIQTNILNYNGYIQVISKVLEPIIYSSYDWLRDMDDYSIISQTFQVTGLADTMNIFREDEEGRVINNNYTLFIEPDSVFYKEGINSIDDLISLKSPEDQNFKDKNNGLYQFAAYHILEGSHFLDDFETRNYNTYSTFPVRVNAGYNLRINTGVEVFDSIITGSDTIDINYLELDIKNSNILSKNGAIHLLNHVMDVFRPALSKQTYNFAENEPALAEARKDRGGAYFFENDDDFSSLSWSGIDQLIYYATSSSSEKAWNKDYILVDGDFVISYKTPKLMKGSYVFKMRANRRSNENATIQVFIDGKKIGGNINLTFGGTAGDPYGGIFALGAVEFSNTEQHTVTVKSLIPGQFIWDLIQFDLPNN